MRYRLAVLLKLYRERSFNAKSYSGTKGQGLRNRLLEIFQREMIKGNDIFCGKKKKEKSILFYMRKKKKGGIYVHSLTDIHLT